MEVLFLKVLNMSLTGSYVILAVLIMRLLLKRAPKKYSYALWAAVGFRLVCPVSFNTVFSLFSLRPFSVPTMQAAQGTIITYIPSDIGYDRTPQIDAGIDAVSGVVNSSLPAPTNFGSVNPLQVWIFVGAVLWCVGMVILAVWAVFSLLRLRWELSGATRLEGNVYCCEAVRSPFILGIFSPRIYIPYGLDESTRNFVLAHERYHLKRLDHVVKLLSYGVLTVHWFNPLCWLAYYLMGRDMEMRCDEHVLGREGAGKADYSMSLLSIASNRRFPVPSPLAFSESGVKMRIKNILNWKKPKFWVSLLAMVLSFLCIIGCVANPAEKETENLSPKFYVTDQCLYISGLSSNFPQDDDSCRYVLSSDTFTVYDRNSGAIVETASLKGDWASFPFTAEEWKGLFDWGLGSCEVDFASRREDCEFLYFSENRFLLRLDETLYIVKHYKHPNGQGYIWTLHSLKEDVGPRTAFGVADPVVEFAMDQMNDLTAWLTSENITVSGGELLRIEQVPTATASESIDISLFAFDYRLSVDSPEEIPEDGLSNTVARFRPYASWYDYPVRLLYEEGFLVPECQNYLLLARDISNDTWTPMWVTTENEIEGRFGTEEMLSEYGNAYTAAAMELYAEAMDLYKKYTVISG